MKVWSIKLNPYYNFNNIALTQTISDGEFQENQMSEVGETETTWRYDEEGNIVYYVYNKKTKALISTTKCKNPNINLFAQKNSN